LSEGLVMSESVELGEP